MVNVVIDDRRINEAFARLISANRAPSEAMASIAVRMLGAVEANFRNEGRPKWKPMAPSTRKVRGPGAKLLQRTSGGLAASNQPFHGTNYAGVGTNKAYARWQQEGTKPYTIKAKNKKALAFGGIFRKEVKHPGLEARPFYSLDATDKDDILDIMSRYLRSKV